jgi:prepilin-type N-terminal cleavage/methylation domain-containing protein
LIAPLHHDCSPHRRGSLCAPGFTLIEMLTVVAIIVLVLGLTLPAITALVRDTDYNSATTQLSGLITTVHSLAVGEAGGADRVGLRFALDNKGGEVVQRVELIARLPVSPDQLGYRADPRKVNRYYPASEITTTTDLPVLDYAMPEGVRVAPLKAAVGWSNPNFYSTPLYLGEPLMMTEFHVVFDNDGQLTCSEVWIDKNLSGSVETQDPATSPTPWQNEYFGDQTVPEWRSTRGLVLYELGDYQGLATNLERQTYMQRRTTPLFISRFTGQLIGPP